MTEARQVYKCNVCGNIVEVLDIGEGELVCCDEPMQLQAENTVDAGAREACAGDREDRWRREGEGRQRRASHGRRSIGSSGSK